MSPDSLSSIGQNTDCGRSSLGGLGHRRSPACGPDFSRPRSFGTVGQRRHGDRFPWPRWLWLPLRGVVPTDLLHLRTAPNVGPLERSRRFVAKGRRSRCALPAPVLPRRTRRGGRVDAGYSRPGALAHWVADRAERTLRRRRDRSAERRGMRVSRGNQGRHRGRPALPRGPEGPRLLCLEALEPRVPTKAPRGGGHRSPATHAIRSLVPADVLRWP